MRQSDVQSYIYAKLLILRYKQRFFSYRTYDFYMKPNLIIPLAALHLLLLGCSPDPEALLNQGKQLMEEGAFAEAVPYLDRAIGKRSGWSEAYNVRAVAYFEQGKYAQAVEDFSRAITYDSASYKPFYNRGNAYQQMQQYPQALEDYSLAISRQPNIKDIYINRGVVHYRLENYAQALEDFNFALKLAEDDQTALLNRAKTRVALQSWEAAISDLQVLADTQQDNANVFYLLGLAYLQTGAQDSGCSSLQKAAGMGDDAAASALQQYCAS